MKLLTDDELEMNKEASRAATAVLADVVEAAARCEHLLSSLGSNGAVTTGGLSSSGLPKRFILAVTSSYVYALEEKQDGGKLFAGKMLECWDRARLIGKIRPTILTIGERVPDDRRVLTLVLPGQGGHGRAQTADRPAGANRKRHRLAVATDAAGRRVIDALVSQDHRPKEDRLHRAGRRRHNVLVRRGAAGSRQANPIVVCDARHW
jgi:hypothetical protein